MVHGTSSRDIELERRSSAIADGMTSRVWPMAKTGPFCGMKLIVPPWRISFAGCDLLRHDQNVVQWHRY